MTRPRGTPLPPRARSRLGEPVLMPSIGTTVPSPSRMIEPLPWLRSIACNAPSSAGLGPLPRLLSARAEDCPFFSLAVSAPFASAFFTMILPSRVSPLRGPNACNLAPEPGPEKHSPQFPVAREAYGVPASVARPALLSVAGTGRSSRAEPEFLEELIAPTPRRRFARNQAQHSGGPRQLGPAQGLRGRQCDRRSPCAGEGQVRM